MARGISLLVAAVFALCVMSFGGVSKGGAQESTVTPTSAPIASTPEVGAGKAQPSGVTSSDIYAPSVLYLTLADAGRSFVIPLNSLVVLNIPAMPYAYLSYNPSILQPYPGWPVPLPQPYNQEGDWQPPVTPIAPPDIGPDIYPYPNWQLTAVGTGTTHLSLEYSPCYERFCPKSPAYYFSVTITVSGYMPPPYPTPIPPYPYPTAWPPPNRPADVYIGTAYLDQVVNVRVGQTIRIELPFIAAHENLSIAYSGSILQPLPGQQLDRPQSGGWLFKVTGAGSTTVTVNRQRCTSQSDQSDSSKSCDPSLLFRVTIKSN